MKLFKKLLGFLPRAAEDKYVSPQIEADKKEVSLQSGGALVLGLVETEEISAADDAGSVYRFFKSVPAEYVPLRIEVYNDAITGATDGDIGIYDVKDDNNVGGTVVDKDRFADGLDFSAGAAKGSPKEGLGAIDPADSTLTLWELAGHSLSPNASPGDFRRHSYDIALTLNSDPTAAGTITMVAWFGQG